MPGHDKRNDPQSAATDPATAPKGPDTSLDHGSSAGPGGALMMRMIQRRAEARRSGYAGVPEMADVNRGSSSGDGAVARARRGLGIGAPAGAGGAPKAPVTLPGGAGGVAGRKAGLIVSMHGKTPEGIAEGLRATGAVGNREVLDALEKLVGAMVVRKAVLTEMLLRTGRANEGPHKPGSLGGERSEQADERAEAYAGKVLHGMESATRENQAMRNQATGTDRPLTHAVSGHGKGTDQVSRLVHGRRADELDEDHRTGKTPTGEVNLSGGGEGVEDTVTPAYTTVGSDASNTSGAFTSNLGMLHVVGEAFAQADMMSQFAESERHEGRESQLDSRRMATTVGGYGEELGYNLDVKGYSEQASGHTLAPDEMQKRFEAIERTDDLQHATLVLDPAFNKDGKRIGWNLQTAYANASPLSQQFSKPGDLRGSDAEVEDRKKSADAAVKEAKEGVSQAEKELKSHEAGLKGKQKGLEAKRTAIGKLQTAGKAVPQKLTDDLAQMQTAYDDAALKTADLQKAVVDAKKDLDDAEKAQQTAARDYQDMVRRKATAKKDDDKRDKPPMGGYDSATGQWTGGRPEKPESSKSLRGTDEEGDSLTAHHLYPWNRIEADLNKALTAKSRSQLEKVLAFGSVQVEDWFWVELAKEPAERSYAFGEELNKAVPKICWCPANIFMGPLGSKRGDDPHEEIDRSYQRSGMMTPSSAVAEMIAKGGGIGGSSRLASMLARNVRDAQGDEARRYSPDEWEEKDGKKVRKGKVDLP